MFEVGDLVKITKSPWYLHGQEIDGVSNEEMLNKVGLVMEKDINPEQNMYLIFVIEDDGTPINYYYYEHELEKAEL
jgi:hypothetical protein